MEYEKWLKRKDLEYKESTLNYGGVRLTDLAKVYGTPVYIVNENLIRQRYRTLKELLNNAYKKNEIHYAVKANSNLSILKILKSEGASVDCSSMGEVYLSLKAGFESKEIIFTGNMFTNDDFKYACKKRVIINLDSLSQLDRLVKVYEETNKEKDIISFRINPEFGVGHHEHTITAGKEIKFGILDHQVIEAYKKAKKYGFTKFGIHTHVGSGIIDAKDYKKAIDKYIEIILNLTEELKIELEFIDFGGGLGIPYNPEQEPLNLEDYQEFVIKPFLNIVDKEDIGEPSLKIEPGRFIVAESSIILTQINTIKDNGYKRFLGTNVGFNTLIRPVMYGSYHHVIQCNLADQNDLLKYDIAGPICESGDLIGKNRLLPKPQEGDFLAILDSGAYGYSMSSTYNSRPRPGEVLIHNGKSFLIRKFERFGDLLNLQIIPEFLKD